MRTSILLTLAGAGAYSHAAVHLSFAKQSKSSETRILSGEDRRSITVGLTYSGSTYAVNVTVGTPGQVVSLGLSTSSAETWISDARYCSTERYDYDTEEYTMVADPECLRDTFSPGSSSTFALTSSTTSTTSDEYGYSYDDDDFYASTDDGAYGYGSVYGRNMTDVLSISGVAVHNLTIGLVNETYYSTYSSDRAPKGVLGVGYNDTLGGSDNLPLLLLEQGLINSTAYSMWLDDDTGSSGNLLFGAVDTTKFTGKLTRLMSSYSNYAMVVRVVGINGTSKIGGPYVINSTSDEEYYGYDTVGSGGDGTLFTATYSPPDTVSILPTDIASQMWDMAGAYYNEDVAQALIGCSAASDSTAHFTMQLGGEGAPIFNVTMADLVIPSSECNLSSMYSSSYYGDIGDDVCLFGVQNGSSYYSSGRLGNTLLRRTYSVFDLANSEVAIAPIVFGATATSNIVPFESYGAAVPSSSLFCSSSYCYVPTGSSSNGNGGGDEESSSGNGLSGILSFGALLGLCLGLAFGCLALGLAGFLVWKNRRNKKLASNGVASASSAEAAQPAMSTANFGTRDVAAPVQTAQQPPAEQMSESVDKGKGREVIPPLPTGSRPGQPESSRTAESTAANDAEGSGRAL